MLTLFVDRKDIPNGLEIIDSNDILFNYDLYHNMRVTDTIKKIMKEVDGAKYLQGMDMHSTFGNVTSMENLSTGCKTMINIVNHPTDVVINCFECGDNVLHRLLQLDSGTVLLPMLPSNAKEKITARVITNGYSQIVDSIEMLIHLVEKHM